MKRNNYFFCLCHRWPAWWALPFWLPALVIVILCCVYNALFALGEINLLLLPLSAIFITVNVWYVSRGTQRTQQRWMAVKNICCNKASCLATNWQDHAYTKIGPTYEITKSQLHRTHTNIVSTGQLFCSQGRAGMSKFPKSITHTHKLLIRIS